ncbi:hypothetical protein [Streptomyces violascens]|uniref:hypothetical protein n=1 Tax=Streptomyces violascens TaxID=67381 RepID=UPI0036B67D17
MALPKDVLEVASTLNRALGVGYAVVKQLPASPGLDRAYSRARIWFSEPPSDGVYLLRVALRHDLGVETEPDFERTRTQQPAILDSERRNLERLLATEETQATRSA